MSDLSGQILPAGEAIAGALVRPARLSDLDAMIALARRHWAERPEDARGFAPQEDDAPAVALLHRVFGEDNALPGDYVPLVLVAVTREGISGYAMAWVAASPPPGSQPQDRVAEVHDLALTPQAWGQGTDRRLLAELVAALRNQGCTAVRIRTAAADEAQAALLRAEGFVLTEVEHRLRLGPRRSHSAAPSSAPVPAALGGVQPLVAGLVLAAGLATVSLVFLVLWNGLRARGALP